MSKLECVIQMCCRDLKQAGLVLICVTGYRKHDSSHPLMSSCRHSFTHFIVSSKCNNRYFFTISHCHLCSLYSPSCLKNVKQTFFFLPPINHYIYAIHSCIHEASIIKPSFISVVSLPVNLLSICYSRESLLNSELSKIAFTTL